jgi:protein O-GlcNAc transferase
MPGIERAIELHTAGRLAEAEAAYRAALAARPADAQALALLGMVLGQRGLHDEAATVLAESLRLKPGQPQALYNLGVACELGGDLTAAARAYRQAMAVAPDLAEARNGLGNVLRKAGRNEQAIECHRAAIRLRPDFADAYASLAKACGELGRQGDATASRRRVVNLRPGVAADHSNLLYDLHYHVAQPTSAVFDRRSKADVRLPADHSRGRLCHMDLFAEHMRWAKRHAEPLTAAGRPHDNTREPGRRLRVGYVSADFRKHPVARFQEPVLAKHDHAAFEVFCYSDVAKPDPVTERLRSYANTWRETRGLNDEQLAAMIRDDRIDVLVDLAGHAAGNRLLAFARRPAPVQVTCNGYVDTTGMSAMDYRLTDALHDPPGVSEHLHTERLVRLPGCNWCYRPDDDSPPVLPPPGLRNAHVTFGSLNKFHKATPEMLDLWCQILNATPGSQLLLVVQGGDEANPSVRESIVRRGINSGRVAVLGKAQSRREYLERFGRVDIALDTFPFNGITTTCDALWMGVPVVSLCGRTHVSRAGLSLLTNVGLGEWVGVDPEAYVRCAVELAGDRGRLSMIRSGLRQRMERSPLRDERAYARAVEAAYRGMRVNWCNAERARVEA